MIAGSDPPPSGEQTFADVLNALTLGGQRTSGRGRRGRRSWPANGATPPDPLAAVRPLPAEDRPAWPTEDLPAEDLPAGPPEEPGRCAAIVRPYAWTRGRTRSTVELRVETLVSTGDPLGTGVPSELCTIGELCRTPRSVAEVAAALAVPLGVAKVLIGDLAAAGSLTVHSTATTAGTHEHLMLMERVLSGLRRL